jgi:hypothetical protein
MGGASTAIAAAYLIHESKAAGAPGAD